MPHSTLPAKLMKPLAYSLLAAMSASALALSARAETHVRLNLQIGLPTPIVVRTAPPPPVVERVEVSPGSGYVWVAGHNTWINGRWVWIPGTWVRPPQPNTIYVEGRWDARSRNWIEPHWEIVATPTPGPVVIVQAPPPPQHEHRGYRPSPDYVWIDGYWAWQGNHHEWVAGRWEMPPHGRHYWTAPRWEQHGGSYVFIEGRWR